MIWSKGAFVSNLFHQAPLVVRMLAKEDDSCHTSQVFIKGWLVANIANRIHFDRRGQNKKNKKKLVTR
jgi:hypothetical protein